MEELVDCIISSYEERIAVIERITRHAIEMDCQGDLLQKREEEEEICTQLQEILAKDHSLRRKDFAVLLKEVVLSRQEREREITKIRQEVSEKLREYLSMHKKTASVLRNNLSDFVEGLRANNVSRVEKTKELLQSIKKEQASRKKEVENFLKEIRDNLNARQLEREEVRKSLRALSSKGRGLNFKDFKETIRNLRK